MKSQEMKGGKKLTGAIRSHQQAARPGGEGQVEAVEQERPVGGTAAVGEAQVHEVEAAGGGGGRGSHFVYL